MELLNINSIYVIEEFGDIIKPIFILVVLPITIFWLYLRNRKYENEKRTQWRNRCAGVFQESQQTQKNRTREIGYAAALGTLIG